MNFWQHLKYKQNLGLIYKTAQDLVRKDKVPEYTKQYLFDNVKQMAWNRTIDRVQWIRCPYCNIEVPSRMMLHQHIKKCLRVDRMKENEPIVGDFKPHFQ